MKSFKSMPVIDLFNDDCLRVLKTMPDDSVDLIVTDPPYFKVKPEGWDNQWKGDDDYLRWLDCCLAEFWQGAKTQREYLPVFGASTGI